MLHCVLSDLVAAIRTSSPPMRMRTRIVAIDGPGGSGKSSLAELLSQELEAQVVHTDDFASWHNPVDWWPVLIAKVLEPLAAGRTATYRPTSWGGPARAKVIIEPREIVVVEGVTATRASFRPYLAYSIWVETPRELRLRRGLDRDGQDALPAWEGWMAEEDTYVARERPADHVNAVLPGDADLWR